MTTGTRLVVLLLLAGTFYVEAEDVTCGNDRKTKEKITIKDGDNFSFKTQAGAEYGGNVKCTVTYKRHKSCPAMKFSCESFALSSTKATCKKGDKMTVKADGANQKYCMNNSPNVTTTGKTIKVTFTSNMNTHGDGAVCSVQCLADATTPSTPIPSTTTTPTPSTPTPTIPTTTEGGCLCPAQYDPICGIDGEIYSNACEAGCAGVEVDYSGECESQNSCICMALFDPVCGVDGETYSNSCEAECVGVDMDYLGECESQPSCICMAQFDPVCGVDGKTYSNSCQAECAEVEVAQSGECDTETNCLCIAQFDPVCGVDGNTYSNSCQARCAGVTVAAEGGCLASRI